MSEPIKPGPWSWQWDENTVGQSAQNIYNFLDDLWSDKPSRLDKTSSGKTLRDKVGDLKAEAHIKEFANIYLGIKIPEEVRVILVDIQKGETKSDAPKVDPKKDPFYVLVITSKTEPQKF